jgi:hypothetical protein
VAACNLAEKVGAIFGTPEVGAVMISVNWDKGAKVALQRKTTRKDGSPSMTKIK